MERHLMDMDSNRMPGCPEPEDLAAFADGTLPGKARTAIELHLADCETCREVVADTVSLSREYLGPTLLGLPRQRVLGGGAALALAASVFAMVVPFGQNRDYKSLVAAVGQNRTVEARLTGGFAYAPLKRPTRAARAVVNEDFALLAAKSKLEESAQARPTPANRHAAAVAHLVSGDADAAIAALESVVRDEPGKAVYHSDLAAAYIARGRAWDRREDLEKAKAAADRAITLDESLDEAYFNRALALDSLGQAREAEAAYRAALTRDPQSPWNTEISMRLDQVRRK
jgi:Tfp pilus assembly protein PilF